MSEKLLEIKNLNVVYETEEATVHGVSLSIERKQTLGLVGETGAGKTTTALAILRLLPFRVGKIEGGEILLEGKNLLSEKEEEMRMVRGEKIAMIFQDPMSALNPVLTVGSQIAEALELHNTDGLSKKEIEKRVEDTLEMVGIPKERKANYPHQFSGGMRQRVVIAMALILSPELLIADEPTTALDVTIQAQILTMICDLQRKYETSVIMITHDLGVVAETCDKVAIVYAGEIVEYGTLSDIFNGGRHHPYTEGLFGSIPSLTEETKRLHPIEGILPDPTNLPKGCKFSPRCTKCMEPCSLTAPAVYEENGHLIRCHLYRDNKGGQE